MKIYLARHGESASGRIDNERELTTQGETDLKNIAKILKPLQVKVAETWCSEKKRAQQTAEILNTAIISQKKPSIRSELDPLGAVDPIIDEINALQQNVLIVGHMPFMGSLTSKLLTGVEKKELLNFQPGNIACLIEIEANRWILDWMISTDMFK